MFDLCLPLIWKKSASDVDPFILSINFLALKNIYEIKPSGYNNILGVIKHDIMLCKPLQLRNGRWGEILQRFTKLRLTGMHFIEAVECLISLYALPSLSPPSLIFSVPLASINIGPIWLTRGYLNRNPIKGFSQNHMPLLLLYTVEEEKHLINCDWEVKNLCVHLQWLEDTDRFAVKLTGTWKVFEIWLCYYGYEVSLESLWVEHSMKKLLLSGNLKG